MKIVMLEVSDNLKLLQDTQVLNLSFNSTFNFYEHVTQYFNIRPTSILIM